MMNDKEQQEQVQIGRCPICGQPIMWKPGTGGQLPVYCSQAHRQKAYRDRKREERRNGR